jgi:hypothetical protein
MAIQSQVVHGCGRLAKIVFDRELIINERPLALACPFFHDAPLVILDEPTAALDAKPSTSCLPGSANCSPPAVVSAPPPSVK